MTVGALNVLQFKISMIIYKQCAKIQNVKFKLDNNDYTQHRIADGTGQIMQSLLDEGGFICKLV